MTSQKKIALLRRLLGQSAEVTVRSSSNSGFKSWKNAVERGLIRIFGNESPELKQFEKLRFFYSPMISYLGQDLSAEHRRIFDRDWDILITSLQRYIAEIEEDEGEESREEASRSEMRELEAEDVAVARSRWQEASEHASKLAADLFQSGSGYGAPEERANDEQRLRSAQEEAKRLFREYEGLAALAGVTVGDKPSTLNYDVFISYAGDDSHLANELRSSLRAQGLTCFMAEKDIPAASDWNEVIRDALHGSAFVVLLLTQRSKDRPWILIEAGAAWALKKEVLPVCNQVSPADFPDPIKRYQARVVETSKQRSELAQELATRNTPMQPDGDLRRR